MKTENERAAFEKWIKKVGFNAYRCREVPRDYVSGHVRIAWSAWKARARLDGRS